MINNVQVTIISVPSLPPLDRQIPESDDKSFYVIRLVANTAANKNGESTYLTQVSATKMNLSQFHRGLDKKKKVTFLHGGKYHKGFLVFTESNI
jgi:hypothetical protein